MLNDLNLFDNEISEVENTHIEYFKSKPSLTDKDTHLRLKDCISFFKFYGVPPIGQRGTAPGTLTYTIGFVDNSLTKEIENDIQNNITKKTHSM